MDKCSINVSLILGDTHINQSLNIDQDAVGKIVPSGIDFPSKDADFAEKMLCTDTITSSFVLIERKKMARYLSEIFASAIVDILSAQDTIMGYPVGKH